MATKEVTICDVFGTVKGVECYKVSVEPAGNSESANAQLMFEVDLSDRAWKRLVKKIDSGITPPAKRKKE
jgi:hypothetical protein